MELGVVRFAHLPNPDSFRTADLLPPIAQSPGQPYRLSQLRYDLRKFRAQGLVVRVAGAHRYRLTPEGFRLCVLLLKLAHRLSKPLASGTCSPLADDDHLPADRCAPLRNLFHHLGIKAA
jgi:hypothetical protein